MANPTYDPTSQPYKIAEHLFDCIRANNAEFKPKFGPKDLQRWANDIRLAHERDGRDYDKLYHMVDWCQSDDFWQSNILSGAKLRAKYDTMAAQANSKYRSKGRTNGRKEIMPKWAQSGASQADSKPKSGKSLTDEQRKQLAERVNKLVSKE